MIVTGSDLQLTGSHAYLDYQRTQESLTAWKDGPNGRQQIQYASTREQLRMGAGSAQVSLQTHAPRPSLPPVASAPAAPAPATAADEAAATDATVDNPGDLKMAFLRLLIEQLTGRAVQVFDASQIKADAEPPPELAAAAQQQQAAQSGAAGGNDRVGWGLNYQYEEIHQESETTQFTAQGIVHTADGKEIALTLELNMARSYASHTSLSVRAGDALKDPLVINFTGNAAQLSQTTFKFDLDADGKADDMRFVSSGSGLLAMDRNGDGKINDGSELFGAKSGNGFADLAQYDDDGNGWIDEKDTAFQTLRVWTRDDAGNNHLLGLLQAGVGALYLGKADTPFAVKDSHNVLQGQIRATGLYLRESGAAGTLQQLDLVA